GGLAVALAEGCVTGPDRLGADVALPAAARVDEVLFGEAPSRIVVTAAPGDVERLMRIVGEWAVPVAVLGRVGGNRLEIRGGTAPRVSVATERLADAFENGLARALEQPIETLSAREAPEAEGRPPQAEGRRMTGGASGGGDQ